MAPAAVRQRRQAARRARGRDARGAARTPARVDPGPSGARRPHEQASAGLDRLTSDQLEALRRLNRSYRERFGFPLIVCVREHTADSILAWGAARLEHSREQETEIALGEITKIARLRLDDLFEEAS